MNLIFLEKLTEFMNLISLLIAYNTYKLAKKYKYGHVTILGVIGMILGILFKRVLIAIPFYICFFIIFVCLSYYDKKRKE